LLWKGSFTADLSHRIFFVGQVPELTTPNFFECE
jgi:hypothetical protein